MKLNSLYENNILSNKEEIQEILNACGYTKKWSIDKNNKITLHANFKLDTNLQLFMHSKNITTLPFKIKRANEFVVYYASMSDYDFAPLVSSTIKFMRIPLISPTFDLHIQYATTLEFRNIDNFEVLNSINKSEIKYFFISDCDDLQFININPETIIGSFINIRNCENLRLENTKLPNFVKHLDFQNLYNVKTFDKNNTTNIDRLTISNLSNLISWRNIDKYIIKEHLNIHNTYQLNNFINVMLLQTGIITQNNPNIDFSKYSEIQNRSEYIMDFAVELIDAGFPEGAEL